MAGKAVVWWWLSLIKLVCDRLCEVQRSDVKKMHCMTKGTGKGQRQRDRDPNVQIGVGFSKQQLRPENWRVLLTRLLCNIGKLVFLQSCS